MPLLIRILLVFSPLVLLGEVYIGWKLYKAIEYAFSLDAFDLKTSLLAILATFNLYPIFILLLRSITTESSQKITENSNRVMDVLLAYPFWYGTLLLAEILPWMLLIEIIKYPIYPLYVQIKSQWIIFEYSITLALFAFFSLYVLVRLFVDSIRVKITQVAYTVKDLPVKLDRLRIVHISDIHADNRTKARKIARYVKKVNKLKPDIVFFTGDLIGSNKDDIKMAANTLGKIKSRHKMYACLGDHDCHTDSEAVTAALKHYDIHVLEDVNEFVYIGGHSLMVTAVTNTYTKRPLLDDLTFLMGHQPRGAVDILLSHQPTETVIELAAERGYQILLAGHTHGGQILLRPFGLAFALAKFETPFYRGFYKVEKMMVSVNNGLGFTFVPVRYRAPAEVTLIELKKK